MGDPLSSTQWAPTAGGCPCACGIRPRESSVAAPARDLAARPRHPRDRERPVVARPARARRLRRHLPRWHGSALAAPLIGMARSDRRPGPHAFDPSGDDAMAPGRSAPRLCGRRQHGRPGDAAAGRPASAVARRRGRLRLRHQLLYPLPRLRADSKRSPVAGARSARGRRDPQQQDKGVRASKPDALGARGRWGRGAATAVVERRRRDRRRPAAPVGAFLRGASQSAAARAEAVEGSWSHTAETYSHLQLPGAVKWLGLLEQ